MQSYRGWQVVFQRSGRDYQPSEWQIYLYAAHDFMANVRFRAEITGTHSSQTNYII